MMHIVFLMKYVFIGKMRAPLSCLQNLGLNILLLPNLSL